MPFAFYLRVRGGLKYKSGRLSLQIIGPVDSSPGSQGIRIIGRYIDNFLQQSF